MIDFLRLSVVFTKCSVLYPNIPVGVDYIICISQLSTIVDRRGGFKFLKVIPDNFSTAQCILSIDTYIVTTIEYPYCLM